MYVVSGWALRYASTESHEDSTLPEHRHGLLSSAHSRRMQSFQATNDFLVSLAPLDVPCKTCRRTIGYSLLSFATCKICWCSPLYSDERSLTLRSRTRISVYSFSTRQALPLTCFQEICTLSTKRPRACFAPKDVYPHTNWPAATWVCRPRRYNNCV